MLENFELLPRPFHIILQITKLPQKDFWYQLDNLQVLFLHDNGISSFDEVKKMSASQQILILTMYDTPLSLKVHYRHFIVNSIWSLKALDHIALSDEELIEDAAFGKKFQSLQPQFLFKSKSLINEVVIVSFVKTVLMSIS